MANDVLIKNSAATSSSTESGGGGPDGARSLTVRNSREVLISGLRSVNSEQPQADGIHVQSSSAVTITTNLRVKHVNCGPGTTNLRVKHVSCGPGHGISIGSLGKERGVENVTVTGTAFVGTENGLRIKTWGRAVCEGAYGVVFEHALMRDVRNPIIIDQNYCEGAYGVVFM